MINASFAYNPIEKKSRAYDLSYAFGALLRNAFKYYIDRQWLDTAFFKMLPPLERISYNYSSSGIISTKANIRFKELNIIEFPKDYRFEHKDNARTSLSKWFSISPPDIYGYAGDLIRFDGSKQKYGMAGHMISLKDFKEARIESLIALDNEYFLHVNNPFIRFPHKEFYGYINDRIAMDKFGGTLDVFKYINAKAHTILAEMYENIYIKKPDTYDVGRIEILLGKPLDNYANVFKTIIGYKDDDYSVGDIYTLIAERPTNKGYISKDILALREDLIANYMAGVGQLEEDTNIGYIDDYSEIGIHKDNPNISRFEGAFAGKNSPGVNVFKSFLARPLMNIMSLFGRYDLMPIKDAKETMMKRYELISGKSSKDISMFFGTETVKAGNGTTMPKLNDIIGLYKSAKHNTIPDTESMYSKVPSTTEFMINNIGIGKLPKTFWLTNNVFLEKSSTIVTVFGEPLSAFKGFHTFLKFSDNGMTDAVNISKTEKNASIDVDTKEGRYMYANKDGVTIGDGESRTVVYKINPDIGIPEQSIDRFVVNNPKDMEHAIMDIQYETTKDGAEAFMHSGQSLSKDASDASENIQPRFVTKAGITTMKELFDEAYMAIKEYGNADICGAVMPIEKLTPGVGINENAYFMRKMHKGLIIKLHVDSEAAPMHKSGFMGDNYEDMTKRAVKTPKSVFIDFSDMTLTKSTPSVLTSEIKPVYREYKDAVAGDKNEWAGKIKKDAVADFVHGYISLEKNYYLTNISKTLTLDKGCKDANISDLYALVKDTKNMGRNIIGALNYIWASKKGHDIAIKSIVDAVKTPALYNIIDDKIYLIKTRYEAMTFSRIWFSTKTKVNGRHMDILFLDKGMKNARMIDEHVHPAKVIRNFKPITYHNPRIPIFAAKDSKDSSLVLQCINIFAHKESKKMDLWFYDDFIGKSRKGMDLWMHDDFLGKDRKGMRLSDADSSDDFAKRDSYKIDPYHETVLLEKMPSNARYDFMSAANWLAKNFVGSWNAECNKIIIPTTKLAKNSMVLQVISAVKNAKETGIPGILNVIRNQTIDIGIPITQEFCEKNSKSLETEIAIMSLAKQYVKAVTYDKTSVTKSLKDLLLNNNIYSLYNEQSDAYISDMLNGIEKDARRIRMNDDVTARRDASKKTRINESVSFTMDSKLAGINKDVTYERQGLYAHINDRLWIEKPIELCYYKHESFTRDNRLAQIQFENDFVKKSISNGTIGYYDFIAIDNDSLREITCHFPGQPIDKKEKDTLEDTFHDWAWVYEEEPFEPNYGIDELLLPENDTRYSDFEKFIWDRDKMAPIDPVEQISDYEFIAKFPNKYPFRDENDENKYEDVAKAYYGVKVEQYYGVKVTVMRKVFLAYWDIWQSHIFEFAAMTQTQALNKMLDYLYRWILSYFNEEDLPHALRVFRQVRWYGEMAVMKNSQYHIIYTPDDLTSGKLDSSTMPDIKSSLGLHSRMYVDVNLHVIRNGSAFLHEDSWLEMYVFNKINTTFEFSLATTTPVQVYVNGDLIDTITQTGVKYIYPLLYTGFENTIRIERKAENNIDNAFYIGNIIIRKCGKHGDLDIDFDNSKKDGNKLMNFLAQKVVAYTNLMGADPDFWKNLTKSNMAVAECYHEIKEYWDNHWNMKQKGKRLTIKKTPNN